MAGGGDAQKGRPVVGLAHASLPNHIGRIEFKDGASLAPRVLCAPANGGGTHQRAAHLKPGSFLPVPQGKTVVSAAHSRFGKGCRRGEPNGSDCRKPTRWFRAGRTSANPGGGLGPVEPGCNWQKPTRGKSADGAPAMAAHGLSERRAWRSARTHATQLQQGVLALPNQVVRLTRVKPSLLTTKGNSAYGIQARFPFLRS